MTKRTQQGEALTELILEVFRLNGAMLDAGNQLTKPLGLTSARWQVMGAIELSGQPLTVSQIARRMGLARQGVQRIVNDLESLGLLLFNPNQDHKRAPLVAITAEGQKTMKKVGAAQSKWVNQLAEELSPRRLAEATKTLQAVREKSESK
jgi:DNA-binding MarR family transcriptional regulator